MGTKKVTVDVSGMTCASCAMTVEKTLNKTPGISSATVNINTEKATFVYDPEILTLEGAAAAVAATGYRLVLGHTADSAERKAQRARRQLIAAWAFVLPGTVLMLAMWFIPLTMHQMQRAHWVELMLAAPVIFVVGYPVLRAAFVALFHGNFNMDILIALGTDSFLRDGHHECRRHAGGELCHGRLHDHGLPSDRHLSGGSSKGTRIQGNPGSHRAGRTHSTHHCRRPGSRGAHRGG